MQEQFSLWSFFSPHLKVDLKGIPRNILCCEYQNVEENRKVKKVDIAYCPVVSLYFYFIIFYKKDIECAMKAFRLFRARIETLIKSGFWLALHLYQVLFIKAINSQLFLKTDTFYETDTWCWCRPFFIIIIISSSSILTESFYSNKLSIRPTTDTLKSLTDTCEVLNVTANYDFREENSCTCTLINTRRFIDNSYLVDRTVAGKLELKSVIVPFKR